MDAVEIKKASVHLKLKYIQQKLKVNKSRGKGHDANAQVTYEYRNSEDILEAVKPLCDEVDAYVNIKVEPVYLGESATPEVRCVGKDRYGNEILALVSGPRFVAVAKAFFVDCVTGGSVEAKSFAAIDFWRKGQTEPEKLSGSADSYATKYALQHLFALDNGKDDPDARPNETTTPSATRTPSSPQGQTTGATATTQAQSQGNHGASAAKRTGKEQAQGQPRSGEQAQERVKAAAKKAWNLFGTLESAKSVTTKEAKLKLFSASLKAACGKDRPEALGYEDWVKVINHINTVKAA